MKVEEEFQARDLWFFSVSELVLDDEYDAILQIRFTLSNVNDGQQGTKPISRRGALYVGIRLNLSPALLILFWWMFLASGGMACPPTIDIHSSSGGKYNVLAAKY